MCVVFPLKTEQNKKLLSQLYNEAKKEIQRQEVRRKLEEVDKDVMKWMQTIQVCVRDRAACRTWSQGGMKIFKI